MSFYDLMYKNTAINKILLKILNIDQKNKTTWNSGRFRDIYLNENGKKIILLTRCGGENREEYEYIFEKFKNHPNYIRDYDDDFDRTYAYIEFNIPDKYIKLCKKLTNRKKPLDVYEKYRDFIEKIKKEKKSIKNMKLFFVRGLKGWDVSNPILVLADTKKEAEEIVKNSNGDTVDGYGDIIFKDNAPDKTGKAGEGYELKKGVIWKQYNAG